MKSAQKTITAPTKEPTWVRYLDDIRDDRLERWIRRHRNPEIAEVIAEGMRHVSLHTADVGRLALVVVTAAPLTPEQAITWCLAPKLSKSDRSEVVEKLVHQWAGTRAAAIPALIDAVLATSRGTEASREQVLVRLEDQIVSIFYQYDDLDDDDTLVPRRERVAFFEALRERMRKGLQDQDASTTRGTVILERLAARMNALTFDERAALLHNTPLRTYRARREGQETIALVEDDERDLKARFSEPVTALADFRAVWAGNPDTTVRALLVTDVTTSTMRWWTAPDLATAACDALAGAAACQTTPERRGFVGRFLFDVLASATPTAWARAFARWYDDANQSPDPVTLRRMLEAWWNEHRSTMTADALAPLLSVPISVLRQWAIERVGQIER